MSYLRDALQWKKIAIAWLPVGMAVSGTVAMFVGIMTPGEWMTSSGIFCGIGTGGVILDNRTAKKVT